MSAVEADLRRQMGVFHGQVVAASTHEFQNHLAVIKEYSGLAGDLLQSSRIDAKEARARGAALAAGINERVTEAAALMDLLNRFTHRVDEEICSFRPGEVLEELAILLARQARGRRISLEASGNKADGPFTSNPSLLQYLVFTLLQPYLNGLAEGGRILLSASPGRGGTLEISLVADGAVEEGSVGEGGQVPETSLRQGLLTHCLESLSCTIDARERSSGRQDITLSLAPLA